MKILVLIHSMGGGGAERVASHLTRHWAACGHRVVLASITGTAGDAYAIDSRVERIGLGLDGDGVGTALGLWNNLRRQRAVRRLLREQRPHIALGMMVTASIQLALAPRADGRRDIGTERTHPPKVPLASVWQWLRRHGFGRLDAVVAQTAASAEWLRAHTAASRVEVIGNPLAWPLPDSGPAVDPGTCFRAGRRTLLMVGRLAPEKQLEHAVEAFAALAQELPLWDLVIVGDGPERKRLEEQIDATGLAGRARLAGPVGNLSDWYARADLFAMTSRFEGFPNTLAEALASGLAVVSYDCLTGPSELIEHEVNGLLVAPQDRDALRVALMRLMRDDSLRLALGQRAVEVRERFSLPRVAAQWDALFASLGVAAAQALNPLPNPPPVRGRGQES